MACPHSALSLACQFSGTSDVSKSNLKISCAERFNWNKKIIVEEILS